MEKIRLEIGVYEFYLVEQEDIDQPSRKKYRYISLKNTQKQICLEYNNNERSIERNFFVTLILCNLKDSN